MQLAQDFPEQLAALVRKWLIPLFILYNIVGWVGLPNREAARSTDSKYTDKDFVALQRALRAAWFAGVLASVVALWIVYVHFSNLANPCGAAALTDGSQCPVSGSGTVMLVWAVVGAILGFVRVRTPNLKWFRDRDHNRQRQILAWLVFSAVAVSCCAGALYYTSCPCLTDVIASFYACMVVGYAMAALYEAAK